MSTARDSPASEPCDAQCQDEGKCSGYCAGDGDPMPGDDSVLGFCPHGVDLDRAFCPEGCRV